MSKVAVETPKSDVVREQERYADKNQEKEWQSFVKDFLPRFAYNTKTRKGTNREFLEIARLPSEVWESVCRDQPDNIKKICWISVGNWYRKWARRYHDYWNFQRAAARGQLKS